MSKYFESITRGWVSLNESDERVYIIVVRPTEVVPVAMFPDHTGVNACQPLSAREMEILSSSGWQPFIENLQNEFDGEERRLYVLKEQDLSNDPPEDRVLFRLEGFSLESPESDGVAFLGEFVLEPHEYFDPDCDLILAKHPIKTSILSPHLVS